MLVLQNAEINKISDTLKYKDVPIECDPNKMTLWQSLLSAVSK